VRYLARKYDARNTEPVPVDSREWTHFRRAAPADTLLAPTLRWVAKLPSNVRPLALLVTFPRVANLLASVWHDDNAGRAYIYDLLIDRRGTRNGFPEDVLDELLKLRMLYDKERLDAEGPASPRNFTRFVGTLSIADHRGS
jgi:hypothetical protein